LLPDGSPESDDTKSKLPNIYLSLTREQRYLDEVGGFAHLNNQPASGVEALIHDHGLAPNLSLQGCAGM